MLKYKLVSKIQNISFEKHKKINKNSLFRQTAVNIQHVLKQPLHPGWPFLCN